MWASILLRHIEIIEYLGNFSIGIGFLEYWKELEYWKCIGILEKLE
jgi:alanyl-tRNA synthetase